MSVFKQKNAIASTEFKGFEGIDAAAPHKYGPAARDMVNFRVCEDGSLQKRYGFAPIAICNGDIRAVWSGRAYGKQLSFIVYGSQVATIDTATNTLYNIGSIETDEGHAKFIFFSSHLYLMDSKRFYRITRDTVENFEGYAPLYAKNWGIGKVGSVNEPLNILSRHIRMNYTVNQEFIYLCVNHDIASIDAVYINGNLLTDKSKYYFDKSLMAVCVIGLKVGQVVDLYLTIAESELNSSPLFSCKQSAVFGGYTDSRLFLWDGDEEDIMYDSTPITNESLDKIKLVYGETVPIYIPEDTSFAMTRSERNITAICRHYDRLLIFTKDDTWMSKNTVETGSPLEALTVNSSRGCTSKGAAVMCENDPICISATSILRWTAETDELNETNAKSISSGIEPYLSESFFTNGKILLDEPRHEIYFYDPTDDDGKLWIYNYKTSYWYKFDGICADELFLCDGTLGFVRGNAVYLFSELLGTDTLADGRERSIVAVYESHAIDLDVAANKKRLLGMTLNANLLGGEMSVEYVSDSKLISKVRVSGKSTHESSFIKRLNSTRFCYLTLRLISDGRLPQRIYSSGVWAKL